LLLWGFEFSFSFHTIVAWSFDFFSLFPHIIVAWSFEFLCLFPRAPLSLGALNFSLTHKPKQTNTQALSHTLKTSRHMRTMQSPNWG
jgi:hypothetical protein